MTMFKPAEIRDHRVHAVAADFDKTLQWHAYCPDTRAAHFSEHVSVLVAVFFVCDQDLWSWIAATLQDSMPSGTIHPLYTFDV